MKVMVVYADILFLNNFFMDYLLISLAGACANAGVKPWRALLAGVLGGVYGVCVFIPDLTLCYTAVSRLLACAAICGAAFLPCGFKKFLKLILMTVVMSFLLGGALYFAMLFVGGGVVKNGVAYMQEAWLLGAAVAAKVLIGWAVRYFKRQASKDIFDVEVYYNGRHVKTSGFLDTGNGLLDPVSGKPAVLADDRILKALFNKDCNYNNLSEWVRSTDLKCIPYHSVGGDGFFYGFVADKIVVNGTAIEQAVVACCDKRLDYGLLLGSGIL